MGSNAFVHTEHSDAVCPRTDTARWNTARQIPHSNPSLFSWSSTQHTQSVRELSAPMIKCKKTPVKKCGFAADMVHSNLPAVVGAERVSNWMDLRSDQKKGLSYKEIASKYNIDPRTAKKYAESETRPVYSLSAAKPSKLDPYKEQIAIWLEEAPYSAERILEKIREQAICLGGRIY